MPLFCFIIFNYVNSVTRTTDAHGSVKTSAGCPARRLSFPVGGLLNEDPPRVLLMSGLCARTRQC